jgi:hypothetical protein
MDLGELHCLSERWQMPKSCLTQDRQGCQGW